MATQRLSPASLVAIVVLAGLAAGTYWLVQRTLPSDADRAPYVKQHIPDYFADDMVISTLSATGLTQYRVNAVHMTHYEDDQTTAMTMPAVRAFTPNQPEVTATSKRGTLNADMSVVDLYDDAVVVRQAGPRDPQMRALSQHFQVLVNDDIVRTELPVQLFRGASVMYGDGMIFNNISRAVQLLGNVHGTIQPAELGGNRPAPAAAPSAPLQTKPGPKTP
ncbi:LPS export ABC transporter periplasmic protein LptC [Pandoraea sp. XJJ-1]|mgnify:CR=1 FL=1|uniref:Lipopolysaccharide export system protein LptC n=1 Tax=Pandoraea cepalis TaxID=2508294 RepID=A0A5E4S647_9BURK|nr:MULTISPECIES: LPS export ABC transporter periplasmic protein LptC [Pandoraea]OJY21537.1 MAG: LPS export ABC transporter periplasmic protein LptC [Pandoraea sp. 64-18]WAL83388.1 LPS export ABC transporter periplasmic protein LptC [Pandoraea sp. XJJ-1]BDD91399.1 LPS export ABC transporter periplasmic protein LptC [Pandoraea sp. NE5]VVD69519.1 Lipopolysaccharide export system protein LptC [Pandoraea cepalis]